MSNLVIVESPAKAKTIQKFLGGDFVVKSSYGHIRDLDEKKLSIEVDNGFQPDYVIPSEKKKVVAELKAAAKQADTVWLASDEDREGEAISWHLAQTLGLDPEKTKRIVFHEITKDAILNAVQNPRTINLNLVDAQQARRVLDRLVGFELSPVLWRKIRRGLSAGRVQSVALRLVVDREKEIIAFQNEPFYRVEGLFTPAGSPASLKLKAVLDSKFPSEAEARKFLEDSIGANYSVCSVESKESVRNPAPPFTTSTLQQEAARKLHLPVATTMRIAQGLYERGLITYMRTDSTNLSSLALNTAKQFIVENYGEEYSHTRQYHTHTKGAQEAHEAIRPTFIANREIEGTAQEQSLYRLIWKRTVASQMAQANLMNTTVKLASDRRAEKFCIQSSRVLFDGFLKLYVESVDDAEESEDLDITLPKMNIGDALGCRSIKAESKFTQAPPRYSEATLVKKLEELGIGRPATYATIISTLTTGRGYIVKANKEGRSVKVTNYELKDGVITPSQKEEFIGAEKGKLLPQEVGMIVSNYLVENFSTILDYDFTANVEKDFDTIAAGGKVWNEVIAEFYKPFHARVEEVTSDGKFSKVSRELGVDPSDGKPLVAKYGQYGAYIQKGDGEDRQFASLGNGQLIETITLEEALKLFELPRTVGQHEGIDIVAMKGRYGPYIKYGDRNISIPRGTDPLSITLEQCVSLIDAAASKLPINAVLLDFPDSHIQILNGRYGPYIKYDGGNYRIPKGREATSLTEAECQEIINNAASAPKAAPRRRTFAKKTK
jgi:DNA topoisomerase I